MEAIRSNGSNGSNDLEVIGSKESNWKDKEQRSDVGSQYDKVKIHVFLVEYKMIKNEIQDSIKYQVSSTACCIPIRFQRHE